MAELEDLISEMLPAVEDTMTQVVRQTTLNDSVYLELHSMLAYHMGWEGDGAGPEARGKRLRPLILLLCCAAAGGNWKDALPAAAAVELLHNFSLIHDDIEDDSPLRRGRPTVWSRWQIPQAINAGDALLSIAHLSIFELQATCSKEIALEAAIMLQYTCLELTKGQYLDMAFESQSDVSIESYWQMIRGKTAALLAACCELGALCAAPQNNAARNSFREFGLKLGLAFQAHDDILGIWGDANETGKSTASDLVTRKKSLPILYGLQKKGAFAERWLEEIKDSDTKELAQMLEIEGALAYAQTIAAELTSKAEAAVQEAIAKSITPEQKAAGNALVQLAHLLLTRQK